MLKTNAALAPEHGLNGSNDSALDDADLDAAIVLRQAALSEAEQVFIQARVRFDGERRRLRELEAERQRRLAIREGRIQNPVSEQHQRKKRSTTGIDAMLGRDGIEADASISRFRLLSLQRQEVFLNHSGTLDGQSITFVDKDTGTLREASTFGEARDLHTQGHTLGRPSVPMQRQAVWYAESGKPGWLRLDQVFVERRMEGE